MRRDFLKSCALTGLGLAAPIPALSASDEEQELPPYEGPYYLVFNASGGWDTTYLMDPKGTDRINRLYTGEQIVSRGNHQFAPTSQHKQERTEQRRFLHRIWFRVISAQRTGLLSEQSLALLPLHGHRKA